MTKKRKYTKQSDEPTAAEKRSFKRELLEQMLTLSTAAFGLVAALAWNEAIKSFVDLYIQPYFPNTAIYYKFFYAILITLLAVFITYQLSQIRSRFGERKNN
jgi:hypothetical protein